MAFMPAWASTVAVMPQSMCKLCEKACLSCTYWPTVNCDLGRDACQIMTAIPMSELTVNGPGTQFVMTACAFSG